MKPDFEQILYHVESHVATITLYRADKLNAMTEKMAIELREAMRRARDDEQVRVIVLTGAGRAFCAGADMSLLGDIQADLGVAPTTKAIPPFDPRSSPDFHGAAAYFPTIPKPVIGAINGPAVGIGFVYALYCDLRIASDSAYVMTAFAKRGAVAEYGASWLLPRLVGLTNATDLMFSSRKAHAEEGLRMGLFNRVVPGADFMPEVMAYARVLATECSPRSLAVMKRQLWNSYSCSLAEDVAVSEAEMTLQYQSEDFKEGVAHFVEKRAPRFTGR